MARQAKSLKRILDGRPDFSSLSIPPRPEEDPGGGLQAQRARRRVSARGFLSNLPLMLGLVIVAGLFLLVLFGPLWAPENPYLVGTTSLTMVDGELQSPPFPPSPQQPLGSDQWGRDILSLLLYGARNTLVAATFITVARVILGTILGIIAGWNEGEASDRLIMGTVGVTTALPLLLTGMILIFALDIRRGISVFLIALCVVGWGEIAQYIRGEFLVLRQRPFIEGARAMGLTGPAIAIRHILPNILPALIVISLLEMGATLMLLGELGFVGVFMGGGTQQESRFLVSATIPDIPEWGAMMADSRVWARGRPWMVFYPALAFFLAVLGFNALGEGLRRLIERGSVNTAFLLSRRMLAVLAVVIAATWYIINNVGPAPSYARLAQTFDGQAALAQANAIVGQGSRRAGEPGHEATAEYLAARFEEYGMQPAGGGRSFFHKVETRIVSPLSTPQLLLLDAAGQPLETFTHQQDFGFRIDGHAGSGAARAPVTALAFDPGRRTPANEDYAGLDLRGQIVLVLGSNMPAGFTTEALIRGAEAVLISEDDPARIRSDIQLADVEGDYVRRPTLPVLAITREAAARVLAAGGDCPTAQTPDCVAGLEQRIADLRNDPDSFWQVQPVQAQVQLRVELGDPQEITLRNVLGYYPGQDVALNRELVVVSAHYDTLGNEADSSATYAAADDSASGLAVMLEIARLWHEQGYTPRRTVLFAAFDGAELTRPGAGYYAEAYGGPVGSLQPVAAFNLTRLGAGGDSLEISASPQRVADLLERSAGSLAIDVRRGDPQNHRYQQILADRIPMIVVQRSDSAVERRDDTLDRLSAGKLQEAGEAINLALIVVSRDASW